MSDNAPPPAVVFEGVAKRYAPVGPPALDGVSFTAPSGAFVAVVGGSGSGKTTLLKTVNRLIEPDAGRVTIDGLPVSEGPAYQLRRRIGYVFQGVGLFPHMTVAENIAATPRLLGWSPSRAKDRVESLLALVDLPPSMASRRPAELSGGQRQRIGLARALAAGPRLMLLDEPFGALDPLTREQLAADYRSIHSRMGLTTFMITHDMGEALLLADRVVVMREGRVLVEGTPASLLSEAQPSYVRSLIEAPRRQARAFLELAGGRL